MKPQDAAKIFRTFRDVNVSERIGSGREFSHTGFGAPIGMEEDGEPGDIITIETFDQPSLGERWRHKAGDPTERIQATLGALAKLGFMHTDGVEPQDGNAPQLVELVEKRKNIYDTSVGKIVGTYVFEDLNPKR